MALTYTKFLTICNYTLCAGVRKSTSSVTNDMICVIFCINTVMFNVYCTECNQCITLLVFQLFDLLGFDRFCLIENLLQNRQKVVRSAFGCDETSTSSASG